LKKDREPTSRNPLQTETAILQQIEAERAERLASLHSLNLPAPDRDAQVTQINEMCDKLIQEKVLDTIECITVVSNISSMSAYHFDVLGPD